VPDPLIDQVLARATRQLAASEDRPSQKQMADAVAAAIKQQRHLIVQAGTGTGKSLAYLVPAIALGVRTVVSTATKALQDQLANRDLPSLAQSLGKEIEFAVLKGRSNYACMQRVDEVAGGEQLQLDPADEAKGGLGRLGREVRRLVAWAQSGTESGDRAELTFEPTEVAWSQVSVAARDCPGAGRCPAGSRCFAEKAKARAALADVVVVNTHLYTTALATGADLLPPHDLVVFDEAHELEDIASSAFGFELAPGRFVALARSARPLIDEPETATAVEEAGSVLAELVRPFVGHTLPKPLPVEVQDRFAMIRERLSKLHGALRKADRDDGRLMRAQQSLGHLTRDVDYLIGLTDSDVAWAEGSEHAPVVRVAPLDVGAGLSERLWSQEEGPTAVLTSATIPPRVGERLGLPAGAYDQLDVGSPYDYDEQALLYCPVHLPDPRHTEFEEAMHDELVALIEAAEGRTLALFTSWRAMRAAADVVRDRVSWEILTQSDLPKPALVARFAAEEHSCLFATMGFWQGVDVPGSALSLVTIDRLPFARPDDPLLQARRSRLGARAFELIDIPRAAALLAQGTGRLIRSRSDRGVVAVFDNRLGKARYRWTLVNSLPPMRRTRSRGEVEEFLRRINTPDAPAPSVGSASSGPP
jgi:ATP-dependent DNA helicase DinG